MLNNDSGKSLGDKIISTKIPREKFTKLQYYCKSNGESINASLKRMIFSEIDHPKPIHVVGKSVFEYNKNKDNFAWKVNLEDGTFFDIGNNLPADTVEQLFESLEKVIEERKSFLGKNKKGSVSLPEKLLRIKK